MSDLFHEKVSFSYIERVFDVIKQAHQHYVSNSDQACGMNGRDLVARETDD